MIPIASWGEYSPQSSAARRRAEQRVDQANVKKAEKTDSTSLATTAIEDNTSACQAGADPEGKEAQCSAQTKSSGEEVKETRKLWTSTRQKMRGIFKSWDYVKLRRVGKIDTILPCALYSLFQVRCLELTLGWTAPKVAWHWCKAHSVQYEWPLLVKWMRVETGGGWLFRSTSSHLLKTNSHIRSTVMEHVLIPSGTGLFVCRFCYLTTYVRVSLSD